MWKLSLSFMTYYSALNEKILCYELSEKYKSKLMVSGHFSQYTFPHNLKETLPNRHQRVRKL